MKFIKYGFIIFKRNLLLNLFIVLQLTISLIIVVTMTSFISGQNLGNTLCKNLVKEDYYLVDVNGSESLDEDIEGLRKTYANDVDIIAVSVMGYGSNMKIKEYGAEVLKYFPIKLLSGQWYFDLPKNEEYINVVVNQSLGKVGDILDNYGGTLNQYKDDGTGSTPYKVCGTIANDTPTFDNNGSKASFNDMFEIKEKIILVDDTKIKDIMSTLIVVIKSGVSKSVKDNIAVSLSQIGKPYDNNAFALLNKITVMENISIYLPIFIMLSIIALLNFVLIILLISSKSKKLLGTYYICGASRGNVVKIMSTYTLIICMASAVVSFAYVFLKSKGSRNYLIPFYQIALLFATITIPFIILTTLNSLFKIKQKDISLILKSSGK